MCKCLLFVHAMSGCDSTSSFFRIRKIKLFNMMLGSENLRNECMIFGNPETPKDDISRVGQHVVCQMYMKGTTKGVNDLRYYLFMSPKYIPPERMPPTSRSCFYHSLHVQFQVCTWEKLHTILDKEEYMDTIWTMDQLFQLSQTCLLP